jgi:amino acid transporter
MSEHDTGQVLEGFGYREEFDRTLHRFASFAIGFSFISITTGIFTTYGSVLNTSGPLGIWTWPIVIVGQTMVALVFGALASRMPLAGYSYQWMSRLANPIVGWILGWLTFSFLVVDVVAVDFALAATVAPALFGYAATTANTWFVTALVVLIQAAVIGQSTVLTERINNIAVGTEIVGILLLTLLLFIVGGIKGDLTGGNLFDKAGVAGGGYFGLGSGVNHVSPWMLAFLLGSFTIVGFEAASNLAEETHDAENVVPRAMWQSVVLSGVIGMVFLIAITMAGSDFTALAASSTPVADIAVAILGSWVGKALLVLVLYSIFACGMVIFVSASRIVWAMSRDSRFPAHTLIRKVDPRRGTPFIAVMSVGVLIEIVLAIFAQTTSVLFNLFSAATLMPCLIYLSTVILYVVARRRLPESKGFSLGAWENVVIVLALIWLVWELNIFRDASFQDPWLYAVGMLVLGLIYLGALVARGHSLVMPSVTRQEPEAFIGSGGDQAG